MTGTGGTGARRWVLPLAAAAAVAAIISGVWWSAQDDGPTITPPQTSGPSQSGTGSPTGSASTTPTTSPSSSPSTSGPATTQSVSLPVYFVGPIGDDKPTYKLFRDFIRSELPTGATPAERAKAALVLAINAQPYSNTDGYLQPWSGQTIGDVTVTDRLITVHLANGGSKDAVVGDENKRLAVQELVWTAQAAIQQTFPVRFEVADGSTTLFGSISTDQTFTRPGQDELWKDVAPIWVTSPSRDQVLPAAKPVVVQGLAIVFEANVTYELRRGSTKVKAGHTTASIGAPMQGTYSFDLGKLTAGDYSIRVFEPSMQGGTKIVAEKVVSFSVR